MECILFHMSICTNISHLVFNDLDFVVEADFILFDCGLFLRFSKNLRENLLPSWPFSTLKKLGPNVNGICVQGEHHLPTIKSSLTIFTSSCQLVKSYIFICSGVRTTLEIPLSRPPKVYCICNFPTLSLV